MSGTPIVEDGPPGRAATAPPPSAAAARLFGDRLSLASRYAELLAGAGVEQGLIGPREVPRVWDRHLVNSALLAELVPPGARVVDVGSGAGLPGLPLAIHRPDISLGLVEPMLRRTRFLAGVVAELDLGDRVQVVRGRAEEPKVAALVGDASWVVARAVAPLHRLLTWCLPLLGPDGTLLAMKGSTAADEARRDAKAVRRLGATVTDVCELGAELATDPTWVISVRRRDAGEGRGIRS